MSLFKNIPLGSNEQRYLQLRLEAFNVFNHPNFSGSNVSFGVNPPSGAQGASVYTNAPLRGSTPISSSDPLGSKFGEYNSTYSGTGGPRVIQLGVKFYF
jgi:hypothetical protein